MSRADGPRVVTANDLRDGRAVWLRGDGGWTREAHAAALFDAAEAEARLAAAAGDPEVVGAYLAPAEPAADGGIRPASLRERLRAAGPSVAPVTERV